MELKHNVGPLSEDERSGTHSVNDVQHVVGLRWLEWDNGVQGLHQAIAANKDNISEKSPKTS